jgi:hypothetical protein
MQKISFDSMEKAAQSAKLERFKRGVFPIKKVRCKPRDPETLAVIQEMAAARARKFPMRFEAGKLIIPSLEFTPKERELVRAWVASLVDNTKV